MPLNNFNSVARFGHQATTAATFIRDILPTWDDWLPTRRRDAASAIRRLAASTDIPLEAIYLTQPAIASLVAKAKRNCRPLSSNNCTLVKSILTRLAGGVWGAQPQPLSAGWQSLYDRIDCEFSRYGVIRFLRFCSVSGIEAESVCRQTLRDFETHLVANDNHLKPSNVISSTVAAWSKVRRMTEGWPDVALSRGTKPRKCTYPLEFYPASFRVDVDAYIRSITFTALTGRLNRRVLDPYSHLGQAQPQARKPRRKPARAATVKGRKYQILQAAAALVRSGYRPEDIVSLSTLIDPLENAEAIADFLWQKAGEKPNGNAAGPIDLLRQIAKYHCGAAQEIVDEISEWVQQATPPRRACMTDKNARRLRQLVTGGNLAMLLHLPEYLMADAEACSDTQEAARIALYATALETLLACPMRLKNLRHLQLGKTVLNVAGAPTDCAYFSLQPDDTKTAEPMLWPIPEPSLKLIRRYVTKFRPTIAGEGNDYLFPGKGQAPRSECAMRDAVTKPLAKYEIVANPHLMRHFAVWLYLKRHPGAYEIVRRILGHRNLATTIRFYAGLEAQFAAVAYDGRLLEERAATKRAAKIFFARSRGHMRTKKANHGRA